MADVEAGNATITDDGRIYWRGPVDYDVEIEPGDIGPRGVLKAGRLGIKAGSAAVRGATRIRRSAENLAEQLAMEEAKGGAGTRIMQGKINDPRYPKDVWAKMQHVHEHPGGAKTVIHYWENQQTGSREGFKFK